MLDYSETTDSNHLESIPVADGSGLERLQTTAGTSNVASAAEFLHELERLAASEPVAPLLQALLGELQTARTADVVFALSPEIVALTRAIFEEAEQTAQLLEQEARAAPSNRRLSRAVAFARQSFERLKGKADALARLAEDTTRPAGAQLELPLCSLRDVLVRSRRSAIARFDGQVEITIGEPVPEVHVGVCVADLTHVLCELIVNGLEACPPSTIPRVELVAWTGRSKEPSAPRDTVYIEVSDAGVELEELSEHHFPLFQTDKRNRIGAGLAICNARVKGWGGVVCVRSPPGRGTTVTVSVPLAGATADSVERRVTRLAPRSSIKQAAGRGSQHHPPHWPLMTPQERLEWLAESEGFAAKAIVALTRFLQGDTYERIGKAIGLSEDGAKYHIRRFYRRFDIKSRDQLRDLVKD